MPIKSKDKGDGFEREAVRILNEKLKYADFKRIPGSGSLGTTLGMPSLTSDISGEIDGFPRSLKIEAKVGYGNTKNKEVKSITLKKEWLDKVKGEAESTYSIPMLICKFDNVHSGVKYFVSLDFETFAYLANEISLLKKELDLVYSKLKENDK